MKSAGRIALPKRYDAQNTTHLQPPPRRRVGLLDHPQDTRYMLGKAQTRPFPHDNRTRPTYLYRFIHGLRIGAHTGLYLATKRVVVATPVPPTHVQIESTTHLITQFTAQIQERCQQQDYLVYVAYRYSPAQHRHERAMAIHQRQHASCKYLRKISQHVYCVFGSSKTPHQWRTREHTHAGYALHTSEPM